MRIAVVVASMGRAEEIGQLLLSLARQTRQPEGIVLSVTQKSDLPANIPDGVKVIIGTPGSSVQRNRGLDLIQNECDAALFYDDDFLPARDAVQNIAIFLTAHPEIAGTTGHVLADGIGGPGLSYAEALDILAAYEAKPKPPLEIGTSLFTYGCNMVFRCTAIGEKRFDENLPRYAWQEDMDFAAQVSTAGKVVQTNAFAGVHRGVKKSRSPGLDLGFSQMVNPVYLVRKGTMTPQKAWSLMWRNFVANHVKLIHPEPYVDRWGRMRGNWAGLAHLFSGRTNPMALPSLRAHPAGRP